MTCACFLHEQRGTCLCHILSLDLIRPKIYRKGKGTGINMNFSGMISFRYRETENINGKENSCFQQHVKHILKETRYWNLAV